MTTLNEIKSIRKTEHNINDLFIHRWSPRSFEPVEINDNELLTLFEAARWSPSSYNNQHWRFIYAKRNSKDWEGFLNLLVEGNKSWAKDASALVCVISKNTFDRNQKPVRTHSFDTGAAWMAFALQATLNGFITHGMEGFDYNKAKIELKVPDDHSVEMMFAVGKQGNKVKLPEQLQKMEAPNLRRPLKEIVFEGKLKI